MSEPIEGLKHQPTCVTAGRHSRCESCSLWYPEGTLEMVLLKDRCPKCAQYAKAGGATAKDEDSLL